MNPQMTAEQSDRPRQVDETIAACAEAGLQATYKQVSSCGGVFTFAVRPQSHEEIQR